MTTSTKFSFWYLQASYRGAFQNSSGSQYSATEIGSHCDQAASGFQYAGGRQLFTGTVGKAILRDRTRSYPDRVYGAHGDAAFADYA